MEPRRQERTTPTRSRKKAPASAQSSASEPATSRQQERASSAREQVPPGSVSVLIELNRQLSLIQAHKQHCLPSPFWPAEMQADCELLHNFYTERERVFKAEIELHKLVQSGRIERLQYVIDQDERSLAEQRSREALAAQPRVVWVDKANTLGMIRAERRAEFGSLRSRRAALEAVIMRWYEVEEPAWTEPVKRASARISEYRKHLEAQTSSTRSLTDHPKARVNDPRTSESEGDGTADQNTAPPVSPEPEAAAEKQRASPLASHTKQRGRPIAKVEQERRKKLKRALEEYRKKKGRYPNGEEYPKVVNDAGVETSQEWQEDEHCPPLYPTAYAHTDRKERKKWRKRFRNEEYRLTRESH